MSLAETPQKQPKILVLEDDPDVRNMLEIVLEDQGYNVVATSQGLDAVEAAKGQSFDLIVADVRMEGMDGLEAIRLTKEEQPQIGTLVVSGYASQEEKARAQQLGVGGYLKKPFKVDEFLRLVREQIARADSTAKAERQKDEKREYLRWSLASVCELALESGLTTIDYRSTGTRARNLAETWGLDSLLATDVEIAVLIESLELFEFEFPNQLRSFLPSSVVRIGEELKKDGVEGLSRETLVAKFSIHQSEEEPQTTVAWPAELLSLDAKAQSSSQNSDPVSQSQDRTLLTLARAFELRGDFATATKAYEEALTESASAAGTTECHFGLMRSHFGLSQVKEAQQQAAKAVAAAKGRGVVFHGMSLLESGWFFLQQSHPKAVEILQESVKTLTRAGRPELQAQAGLALAYAQGNAPQEEQLELLFQPSNLSELAAVSRRMMKALLELTALSSRHTHYLTRLCLNFPREVARQFGRLKEELRVKLAESLLESNSALPTDLVELLLLDESPSVRKTASQISRSDAGNEQTLVEVYSTGQFRVSLGGELIPDSDWKTQKVRGLLAYLAYDWGKPQSADFLMEMLWPGKSQDRSRKNLWWTTAMIRKSINQDKDKVNLLLREGNNLRLNPEQLHWHDVNEIEKAIKDGESALSQGESELALKCLEKVPGMYSGNYLEGIRFEWAEQRRRELGLLMERGLQNLGTLLLRNQDYQKALSCANTLLEIEPFSQDGYFTRLASLHGLGQSEQCMKEFEKYQALLLQEFGSEPAIRFIKLYQTAKFGLPLTLED